VANKRGCLGCSFPLVIGLLVVFLVLFIVGFVIGPLGQSMLGIEMPEWLSGLVVDRPAPHLPAETVFHIFGFPITNSVIGAWITIIVLVGISYIITRRMKLVPGRLQAAFEFLIGWLYDLCVSVAGEENGRRFFPVVATIFLLVGFNAWLALLPGFGSITAHTAEGEIHLIRAANTDINMPLALALTSFVFVEFYGLKTLGIRYLGKFLNFRELFAAFGQLAKGKVGAVHGGHDRFCRPAGGFERVYPHNQPYLPTFRQHDGGRNPAIGGRFPHTMAVRHTVLRAGAAYRLYPGDYLWRPDAYLPDAGGTASRRRGTLKIKNTQ